MDGERAKKALEIYVERTEKLIAHLEARQFDGIEQLLVQRRAAFHNFRAIDHLVQAQGGYGDLAPEFDMVGQRATIATQQLTVLCQELLESTAMRLSKAGTAGRVLSRFHSNKDQDPRFLKLV
jgi:hypothetical protein